MGCHDLHGIFPTPCTTITWAPDSLGQYNLEKLKREFWTGKLWFSWETTNSWDYPPLTGHYSSVGTIFETVKDSLDFSPKQRKNVFQFLFQLQSTGDGCLELWFLKTHSGFIELKIFAIKKRQKLMGRRACMTYMCHPCSKGNRAWVQTNWILVEFCDRTILQHEENWRWYNFDFTAEFCWLLMLCLSRK